MTGFTIDIYALKCKVKWAYWRIFLKFSHNVQYPLRKNSFWTLHELSTNTTLRKLKNNLYSVLLRKSLMTWLKLCRNLTTRLTIDILSTAKDIMIACNRKFITLCPLFGVVLRMNKAKSTVCHEFLVSQDHKQKFRLLNVGKCSSVAEVASEIYT